MVNLICEECEGVVKGSRRKKHFPACRFWSHVKKSEGCWIWNGFCNEDGYGRVTFLSQTTSAHRVSYFLVKGPISPGMEIDHLCRNRSCVNPYHLEAVTHKENVRRGMSPPAIASRAGTCTKGHAMRKSKKSDRTWCPFCQKNRARRTICRTQKQ